MLEAMSRRAMELDGIQQQLKVREIQKLVDELAGELFAVAKAADREAIPFPIGVRFQIRQITDNPSWSLARTTVIWIAKRSTGKPPYRSGSEINTGIATGASRLGVEPKIICAITATCPPSN